MIDGVLPREFYARAATAVARELLGARLIRRDRGRRLTGIVVETEAYSGAEDLGSHARTGRTARNRAMFGPPGHVYVYFTYGMHWMLNLVTESDGQAGAVLIRAIAPEQGIALMRRRRQRPDAELCNGPGKLCQAFGIDARLYGADACDLSGPLTLVRGVNAAEARIVARPRIGLNGVPEPWKSKKWNYTLDARR